MLGNELINARVSVSDSATMRIGRFVAGNVAVFLSRVRRRRHANVAICKVLSWSVKTCFLALELLVIARTSGLSWRSIFREFNGVDLFELRPRYSVSFALRIPACLFEGVGAFARDWEGRSILIHIKESR